MFEVGILHVAAGSYHMYPMTPIMFEEGRTFLLGLFLPLASADSRSLSSCARYSTIFLRSAPGMSSLSALS